MPYRTLLLWWSLSNESIFHRICIYYKENTRHEWPKSWGCPPDEGHTIHKSSDRIIKLASCNVYPEQTLKKLCSDKKTGLSYEGTFLQLWQTPYQRDRSICYGPSLTSLLIKSYFKNIWGKIVGTFVIPIPFKSFLNAALMADTQLKRMVYMLWNIFKYLVNKILFHKHLRKYCAYLCDSHSFQIFSKWLTYSRCPN